MLVRFCLYGFLKNQRYFEPFLVLAFLEKGLGFFEIGLLVAFRELMVNLWEIPSGAIADVFGRRASLIVSFSSYIASFLLLGAAAALPWLFVAMFFFAVGDAFRTGTHKAMIFRWLRLEGREGERTRVYGLTRSWSKLGSAVSVLLAALFVTVSDSYTTIFYFATVPYVLSIVNFLGYPRELEGARQGARSPMEVARHLRRALASAWRERPMRRLMIESMGYEGVFHAVKDYLQPVVQVWVLAAWGSGLVLAFGEVQQTALLIGPVYFAIYLLAAAASRNAHRAVTACGGEQAAARVLWAATCLLFMLLTSAAFAAWHPVLIVAFALLHVLQNFWRPILVARVDAAGDEAQAATLLSVESQSRRVVTMAAAPLLGWAVDRFSGAEPAFWPIGLLGLAVSLAFVLWGRSRRLASVVDT